MVNIKVAVRIRPLSERELLLGDEKVVQREKNSVLVTNPKIPQRQDGDSRQRTRRFTVDFCYDSTDPEGSTQESVYKEIGSEVLHSMYEGYNSCVLAYGPSASGKTYTIMGLQGDPGLTPRLCEGLFEKLMERKRPESGIHIQVAISFLEIYNEKVRDLLGGGETGATCRSFSLRVREHPKLGPYVQGLSQHFVTEKKALLELLATGNKRRSTAATENNIHSSRSHAVFTIQFKQSDGGNYETEKSSKVHLVDLAGSERASSSQDKTRLQEGANINKSLVTLGNVISALAESCESGIPVKDQSGSKCWQPFVPYRDSVLTWLLKDTLGGNSNTIMIATISPASSCLSETVNTLRYAKRTKKIVNQPVVNEDPKIRTIRELRREIARLKDLLIFLQSCDRIVDSEGSRCGSPENNLEEIIGFSSPESKWQEPEETHDTNTEWDCVKKENCKKKRIIAEKKTDEDKEKKEEICRSESSTSGECETGVRKERGDACEISDEKKSDVNRSVNDNFSHENQIFSDSLESFPFAFFERGNSRDVRDDDASEKRYSGDGGGEMREENAQKPRPINLTSEFCSYENLWREGFPEMLHRSRPDLIKGISTRSKESLPSGNSQSCTDVSNLSLSNSENFLISSSSGNRSFLNHKTNKRSPSEAATATEKNGTGKESRRSDDLETTSKKKEKRSEIVGAVTSRLYVCKKTSSTKTTPKKDDDDDDGEGDDDGESEELKLCKRARMKLFDLSRRLAIAKKTKKTVDSDTQTPSTRTLRVKEKCVTTDASGKTGFDAAGTLEKSSEGKREPCVIMNQVFIPRASSYVVECGNVVRVEAPGTAVKQESATQTSHGDRSFNNANTSPIKISPREEDCFSEDSLDLDIRNRNCGQTFPNERQGGDEESASRSREKFDSSLNLKFSRNSEREFTEGAHVQNLKKREELDNVLLNGLPVTVFVSEKIPTTERTTFFSAKDHNNILEPRQTENLSSENSFTSADGTEINSVSETSSEDFVFFENFKDGDLHTAAKVTSDRELYTITENSEQSDPSDGFSPVQKQNSYLKTSGRGGETGERTHTSENEAGEEHETFDEPEKTKERFTPPKSVYESVRPTRDSVKNEFRMKVWTEHFHKAVTNNFTENLRSNKNPLESPNLERTGYAPRATWADRFRAAFFEAGSDTEGRCRLKDVKSRGTQSNADDYKSNSQEEYLNLNISNSGSTSRAPPFSVDTHLFGKPPRKDQSTDAMSTSADSITFVFMGPAKPKTSVLIELIQRSLGRNFHPSEIPFGQRKCRSRGVQCEASLMRSVSVDTAMIALSRIARNQESFPEVQKTNSLEALSTGEIMKILGGAKIQNQSERSFHCEVEAEIFQGGKEKCTKKRSLATAVNLDECWKNPAVKNGTQETEKPKKSVSWFGDGRNEVDSELRRHRDGGTESEEHGGSREFEVADSKPLKLSFESFDFPERRVRFVKPEQKTSREPGLTQTKAATDDFESADSLACFLKEATHLLRSINSRSSNSETLYEEAAEDTGGESRRKKEGNRAGALRTWKKSETPTGDRAEEASRKSRTRTAADYENRINLTWPRRRATTGKPPTGTRPKFSKSLLHSRFDSSHCNGFQNFTTNSRTGSSGQTWNLSNLSVALNNSFLGETRSRSSSFRSCCNDAKWVRNSFLPPVAVPKPNVDPLSELEAELEECCRRLEMTTERDEMRERIWESRKVRWDKKGGEFRIDDGENAGKRWSEIKKPEEALKRKTDRCAGGCTCGTLDEEPCRRLWSRGCRSSFELDSFGPGRMHCYQLCMFCRRKEKEIYYSALNLNSECSFGLCRLDYYGFCPCSPVKLTQVVASPRAYMQRLLALRKQIVTETNHLHLDSGAARRDNRQRFSCLGRSSFPFHGNEL